MIEASCAAPQPSEPPFSVIHPDCCGYGNRVIVSKEGEGGWKERGRRATLHTSPASPGSFPPSECLLHRQISDAFCNDKVTLKEREEKMFLNAFRMLGLY